LPSLSLRAKFLISFSTMMFLPHQKAITLDGSDCINQFPG